MGLRVGRGTALHQACTKRRQTECLSQPAHVAPRVLEGAARPPESFLACLKTLGQTDGRQAGQCDSAAGNASATIDHFEAETVCDLVALGLVHLYQHVFLRLSCDLAPRINLGPVKYAQVVEAAF